MKQALDEFLEGGRKQWWFTFGFGHAHPNGYVVISGRDKEDARLNMVERFGQKWAFQYNSAKEAGVDQFEAMYNVDEAKYEPDS